MPSPQLIIRTTVINTMPGAIAVETPPVDRRISSVAGLAALRFGATR